jgi:hypothetical protein
MEGEMAASRVGMTRGRKLVVFGVTVAALTVATAASAAGVIPLPGTSDPTTTTTSTTSTSTSTTSTTSTTTTTVVPHDAVVPGPTTDTTPNTPGGPSGCLTHGQKVSQVAHDTPPGPGHGAAVSAAAHDHTGECVHPGGDAADDSHGPPAESHSPGNAGSHGKHGDGKHS